jgi:hypothetical protein
MILHKTFIKWEIIVHHPKWGQYFYIFKAHGSSHLKIALCFRGTRTKAGELRLMKCTLALLLAILVPC